VAQQLSFAPGTVVVDDRGYNDYGLFGRWTAQGVFFVTRLKDNAQYEVVEAHAPPQNRGILCDQTIRLTGLGAQEKCPHLLRRVEAVREDTGETLVFLTNHHKLGASTIAAIYKDRWSIELFFDVATQCTSAYVSEYEGRAVRRSLRGSMRYARSSLGAFRHRFVATPKVRSGKAVSRVGVRCESI